MSVGIGESRRFQGRCERVLREEGTHFQGGVKFRPESAGLTIKISKSYPDCSLGACWRRVCGVRPRECPVRLGVRTPPFHGGNTGSNPVPDTIFSSEKSIIPTAEIRLRTYRKRIFCLCSGFWFLSFRVFRVFRG